MLIARRVSGRERELRQNIMARAVRKTRQVRSLSAVRGVSFLGLLRAMGSRMYLAGGVGSMPRRTHLCDLFSLKAHPRENATDIETAVVIMNTMGMIHSSRSLAEQDSSLING